MLVQSIRLYIILLVAGLSALVFSCEKPEEKTNFTITGIRDVSLGENGSASIELQVEQVSAKSEQVTLSVEGLPNGVTATFNKVTDRPSFGVSLYVKDDSSKKGEYPITLKAVSASGVEKTFSFKIFTVDKTCAKKASGLYHATSICRDGKGLIFNNFYFWNDSTDLTRLYFNWNQQLAYAVVNCNKNQLEIPLQTVGDYKIYGQGYIDENYTIINIDYTQKFNNGDTVSCNAHFIKKK